MDDSRLVGGQMYNFILSKILQSQINTQIKFISLTKKSTFV